MSKNCLITRENCAAENDSLRRYNSVRVYFPNGCNNYDYMSFISNDYIVFKGYANKEIFNVDGVPSKKKEFPSASRLRLTLGYSVSGFIYVDIIPMNKIIKVSKESAHDSDTFVDIKEFVGTGIQELDIPRNYYENREIALLGHMEKLTSFISSRSKYSGSIENMVEKTIEKYPTKEKSLLVNLYQQHEQGGTVTFHDALLAVALYIEFNGDGTANVYNNTDHTTVIASYNGTTWTYV